MKEENLKFFIYKNLSLRFLDFYFAITDHLTLPKMPFFKIMFLEILMNKLMSRLYHRIYLIADITKKDKEEI